MASQLPINLNPEIVVNSKGQAVTSSQSVAAFFVKRHDDVLKKIRNLDCSTEFHNRNFAEMFIDLKIGNGAKRKSPYYQMTKNGFVFLVMGFTGKQAALFKESYIAEFDRMESELAAKRYDVLGNASTTNKADLIALVDELQKVIHEGEFIPAGHALPEYSFPKTRKPRSRILEDFISNPKEDVLHQLIAWLKKDGHNMEDAERVLMHIRDCMMNMAKAINTIQTHAQYIDSTVSKLL
ncbi:Rha family transcriptional regulator [Providencia stuartii]|uniref:Rha family transcriptional regulator n=1 Tax=Providencia stuartii TaxID=588 RepID=UPI000DF9984F|nr:Rha family transcriptional regulator [Providencia stuartii]MDN0017985.1 Rha family transcriptional regulator [Providencia stuartii]SUC42080.1 Uncharacterized phage-encoded protein [Providencia stuartii]